MQAILDQLITFAAGYGLKVIGALLILILGRVAAGLARKFTMKILAKANVDATIITFMGTAVYWLVLAFAVVAALSKFGVETASFIAVLGAAGFAVGFALQGSLSNFAAGVLILVLRPYRVGDYIEAAGVASTVKAIELFTTVLATPDNIKILVPNGKIYGDIIRNVSAYDTRRIDLVVGIGYDSPIGLALETLSMIMTSDSRVLKDPAPQVMVSELADSSVNLIGRLWVRREDYWPTKCDLTRRIKEVFDEKGIEIPFPQRVVHLVGSEGAQGR